MRVFEWYECVQDGKQIGPIFDFLEQAFTQAFSALLSAPGSIPPPVLIMGSDAIRVVEHGAAKLLRPERIFVIRMGRKGSFVLEPYNELEYSEAS